MSDERIEAARKKESGMSGVGLRFDYTNHRGEDHEYIVVPVELSRPDAWWSIEADVVERDGEPRPGRRTFRLSGLRDVGEVLLP